MTNQDKYEYINPFAFKWCGTELHVLEQENDPSVQVFDTEAWDVKVTIEATRKPEPIKAGQGWWDDRVDFETESVEIIGVLTHNGVTYVAYVDYQGLSHLLQENNFRSHFHRDLSE